MAPTPYSLPRVGIALLVISIIVVGMAHPTVNDLPGFSDHTGPTDIEVTEFERLDAGCEANVSSYRSGSWNGDNLSRVSFVPTASPDTALSAWAERTSPTGADLSTFRVHVDALNETDTAETNAGSGNASCKTGVLYRINVNTTGGTPQGFLPDAHGTRVLWLQNGEYSGCSASVTSPLDDECERFRSDSPEDRLTATAG